MKLSPHVKKAFVETICLLYILLFVYAAISKLLDFQNFAVQVGQSPLLTAFAGFVSVAVIVIELLIALLLAIPATRLIGLFGAFCMMLLFTLYIFIILNYSSFVPCSCGGILENMGWKAHLYFNIIFTLLSVVGVILLRSAKLLTAKSVALSFVLGTVLCSLLITGLFLASEDIVQHRNNFVRRFPPFPAKRYKAYNLKFNSYYFSGADSDEVFLGNRTAPGLITVLDSSLTRTESRTIKISDTLFKFHNVQLRIVPPNFYIWDGTVPCIYKGNLSDHRAVLQSRKMPGFTKAVIRDTTSVIVRGMNGRQENVLALLDFSKDTCVSTLRAELLQKQKDGLFDTDGTMHYDSEQGKFVYLYYYRNQYIVANHNLSLLWRGNTIDTTTQAKVQTTYIKSKHRTGFAAPPFMVNPISAIHDNLLFVQSNVQGKYEVSSMWKKAHVIDVYDYISQTYLMSFYVYKIDGEKIDDMIVTDTHLFVLMGNNIVSYRLSTALKKKFSY